MACKEWLKKLADEKRKNLSNIRGLYKCSGPLKRFSSIYFNQNQISLFSVHWILTIQRICNFCSSCERQHVTRFIWQHDKMDSQFLTILDVLFLLITQCKYIAGIENPWLSINKGCRVFPIKKLNRFRPRKILPSS